MPPKAPRDSNPQVPTHFPKQGPDQAVYKPRGAIESPWIFRKMIHPPESHIPNGAYITLIDREGRTLGRGFLNRQSQVAFRLLGGPDAPPHFKSLLRKRLASALELRTKILRIDNRSNAYRLIHGEADGLSGLIVDRYGSTCVASLYSLGYVAHAEYLEDELKRLPGCERVVVIGDPRSMAKERFTMPTPRGRHEETITENGVRFLVRPGLGHKTGFFLDQRDNRYLVSRLAQGRRVLDLCTNTGGFAISAATRGKAKEVVAVDLDEEVLEDARNNAKLNRARVKWIHADIFPWLRDVATTPQRFDLVVLDPARQASGPDERGKALHAYRDMNRLALEVVAPKGLFLSCSCTGVVSERDLLQIIHEVVHASGRSARVLEFRGAAADHPVGTDFPEGRYLKAILLQVD